MRVTRIWKPALAITFIVATFCGDAQSQVLFSTLYDFGAPANPTNLIAGPGGIVYGAADNGANARGTVFEFTPGQAGMTVLYTLTATDGAAPAAIALGPGGAIFGTTAIGGPLNDGTVFELTPPPTAGGSWTSQILHSFAPFPDGANPAGNLAIGPHGEIYGATMHGGIRSVPGGWGTVFELAPPAMPGGIWTETILYAFTGGSDGAHPDGGVILGPGGSLYGTTAGGGASGLGTVFQLTPPATAGTGWTETVLHSFAGGGDGSDPHAGLVFGLNGALYGTTRDGGTSEAGFTGEGIVFELRPPVSPGGPWREQILYKFQPGFPTAGYYPVAPVTMGPDGAIYGTTCCGGGVYGVVFELQPPSVPGSVWTETVLHTFTGGADGGSSYQGVLLGPGQLLYGTASGVGTPADSATIFAIKP